MTSNAAEPTSALSLRDSLIDDLVRSFRSRVGEASGEGFDPALDSPEEAPGTEARLKVEDSLTHHFKTFLERAVDKVFHAEAATTTTSNEENLSDITLTVQDLEAEDDAIIGLANDRRNVPEFIANQYVEKTSEHRIATTDFTLADCEKTAVSVAEILTDFKNRINGYENKSLVLNRQIEEYLKN